MTEASATQAADRAKRASKMRRDGELEQLYELEKLLPLSISNGKMDKAAIIRLTSAYLQLKQTLTSVEVDFKQTVNDANQSTTDEGMSEWMALLDLNESELLLSALDGCIVFLDENGKVVYMSDNAEENLGINQMDILGHSILSYIHKDDHKELFRQFSVTPPPLLLRSLPNVTSLRCCNGNITPASFVAERGPFYVRMRYSIARPGCKTRTSGYLLTQWSGRLQLGPAPKRKPRSKRAKDKGKSERETDRSKGLCVRGLVALIKPMQPMSVLEIRLDGNMFITHHSMTLEYTFCDTRILTLIGYEPNELIGKSAYLFHNPVDAVVCQSCHNNLISRGTSVSKYYRFLGKTGEWVWMQTRATIITNAANQPQYIVCMNYVIGQNEGRRHLMMEREEAGIMQGEHGEARGAIDVTCLSSPGSKATSSGYCSAEEDHSYSNTSRSYDVSLSATPESGSANNSQPQTPSSIASPEGVFNMDLVGTAPLSADPKSKSEFCTEDINLDDLIDDWLDSTPPEDTMVTGEPSSGVAAAIQMGPIPNFPNWSTDDVDMMDVDTVLGTPTSNFSALSTSDTNILIGLLKEAEKKQQLLQAAEMGCSSESTREESTDPLVSGSMPPPTSDDPYIPTSLAQNISISVTSFPYEMMDSDGNMVESVDDYALKFGVEKSVDTVKTSEADCPGLGSDYLQIAGLNADNLLLSGITSDINSAGDASGFPSDSLMSAGLSSFLQDGQNPPLTGNPFMLSECSQEENYVAVCEPDTVMSTSSSVSNGEAVMLSTPTTMYIPTPSGMRSITVPQTALNKNPPISIVPANVKKLSLISQASTSSSTPSQSRSNKITTVQSSKLQQKSQSPKQPSPTPPPAPPQHNTSFLDDHRYTSRQPHEQPKSSNRRQSSNSSSKRTPGGSILEHFLTTRQRVDPQKGSDAALAAQGLSQLKLHDHHAHRTNGSCSVEEEMCDEGTAPLLKKLLTGEMDHGEVRRHEQQVIEDRRGVSSTSLSEALGLDDSLSLEESDQCIELNLLGADPGSQMDKIWTPSSPKHDVIDVQ